MLFTILRSTRSTSATRLAQREVTHRLRPSSPRSMQSGPPGTLKVSSTFRSVMSMQEIESATRFETSSRRRSPMPRKLWAPAPVRTCATGFCSAPVDHLDVVLPHDADEQVLLVRRQDDARRLLADRHLPEDLLRDHVDGDDFVRPLQRHEDVTAVAGEPEVAGQLRHRYAPHQLPVPAVEGVDVDPVEPERGGDEPAAIRRKRQLVRIVDAAQAVLYGAGDRVEEEEFVGSRTGDDQLVAVRRRIEVVRLLADVEAPGLGETSPARSARWSRRAS